MAARQLTTRLITIAAGAALALTSCQADSQAADSLTEAATLPASSTTASPAASPSTTSTTLPAAASEASPATSTTTTSLPDCEQNGYIRRWNREDSRWGDCQRPPQATCGRNETPTWRQTLGDWYCKRPPRLTCQEKGYVSEKWIASLGEWEECRRPEPWRCGGEYPESRWVAGEWGCYKGCEDGEASRIDSDGAYCYPLPDCGPVLIHRYIPDGDYYDCSETAETAAQFWEFAFYTLETSFGFDSVDLAGKWIGGLAGTHHEREWQHGRWREREPRESDKIFTFHDADSLAEYFQQVRLQQETIDICYDHDCDAAGNLIGSTMRGRTSCRAFVWSSEAAVWMAMRIDDSSPVCRDAYEMTLSGHINGMSLGGQLGYLEETDETGIYDGAEYPVFYLFDMTIDEISLAYVDAARNTRREPVDKNSWVAATERLP